MMYSDYTIASGRLINNAPELESGISKAARLRQEVKRADKVSMIAEGNEMASARMKRFK
jgi:hypothetical protein|tara:strand:+ start:888 stop:1064 length:177 start_codon:yes stop_codon:yes gene_type:complete